MASCQASMRQVNVALITNCVKAREDSGSIWSVVYRQILEGSNYWMNSRVISIVQAGILDNVCKIHTLQQQYES